MQPRRCINPAWQLIRLQDLDLPHRANRPYNGLNGDMIRFLVPYYTSGVLSRDQAQGDARILGATHLPPIRGPLHIHNVDACDSVLRHPEALGQ